MANIVMVGEKNVSWLGFFAHSFTAKATPICSDKLRSPVRWAGDLPCFGALPFNGDLAVLRVFGK